MKKIAFLFPGQGSQAIGMGKELEENVPAAAECFRKADQILEMSMHALFSRGEEEELKKTENTQPALFITSAATFDYLKAQGIEPSHVAGHSLGEYTALYAAGTFDFETGVRLVRARGIAFANAGKHRAGTMAAIIGLPGEKVREICQSVQAEKGHIVVPANFNEPNQTVISGDPDGIREGCAKATEAGAKRALVLPVSGAFHSPLVQTAAEIMHNELHSVSLKEPQYKFVNNVSGTFISSPLEIRKDLIQQVTSSVQWVKTIQLLIADGVDTFVEVGSGKVLAGLVRRIDKSATTYTTESWDSIQKTVEDLKA